MTSLKGLACVATGATGALGHAVTRLALERGAHVAAAVRDRAKGDELVAAMGDLVRGEHGPRLLVVEADPGDRDSMDRLVETVLRTWGRLDVLANLAGGYAGGTATDAASIEALWRQNVLTAVTATAACIVPMRARRSGRVVCVGSTAAARGGAKSAGYAMAKTAILRFVESLAAEVKDEGITVNAVLPSSMPKLVTYAEVAAAIAYLASKEAGGVTGSALAVPGRA